MDNLERSWLAGFIDGDGCISVRRYNSSHGLVNPYYQLSLQVVQNNKSVLEYIRRSTGYGNVFPVGERGHQLEIVSNQAKDLLKELLPFFVVKKLQVQLGIQFHENKAKSAGRRGTSEAELGWREMHYQLLRVIKQKVPQVEVMSWPGRSREG